MRHLFDRLVEYNFLKPCRDFLPLSLGRLVEVVSVGVESLMKEANYEQWLVSAPRSSLCKPLQQKDVLAIRVECCELQELSKFINDE